MIILRRELVKRRYVPRILVFLLALTMTVSCAMNIFCYRVSAAATTVTLRYGSSEFYGNGSYGGGWTTVKWVTHIDGEPVDLDEVPGVSRSYAYCVQPTTKSPDPGTYKVTVVDDDDTGKVAKMRKLIYYLPGAYGYTKVTKKRWFAGNNTGASDYAIGHMALSWIHANYSDSVSEVWDGVGSTMKSKVKSIVSDLGNLPEPPDTFEVFWVKVSGRQDVFGAFYSTEYGAAKVKKLSMNESISEGNSAYALTGAEYTFYEDENCKTVAKTAEGKNATVVVKSGGTSDEITLETGDYYVKETKAPKGYAIDDKVRVVTVNNGKTTTLTVQDAPIHTRIEVLLHKLDEERAADKAQGDASLEGAVYKFSYYDSQFSSVAEAEASGNAKAVWHFKTDSKGVISGSSPIMADGYQNSELLKDAKGRVIFLLGTYVIQEVESSTGYLVNDKKILARVKEDGKDAEIVKTYNENLSSNEKVIRGGVKLAKIDNDLDEAYLQGDASFSGAEFTIYNRSKESVIVDGKEIAKDAAALVIKTDSNGIASTGIDALPYGTYMVKESKAPSGYLANETWCREFQIRENGKVVDLSEEKVREAVERSGVQIIKRDKELAKSEAIGAAKLDGIVFTIKNASAHDVVVRADIGSNVGKVDWKKLESKKTLFEDASIKRVKPGEDIGVISTRWNEEKKAYTAETLPDDLPYGTYTIRESKTNDTYQRTDKTEHRFEVRADGTLYAYDSEGMADILTFDDYVYRSDMQGTKIGDGDSKRFSFVPFKISSVSNGEVHVVVADKNGFFSTRDRRTKDAMDEDEAANNTRKLNPLDDLLIAKDIKKSDMEKRYADVLMGVWFGTGEFGAKAEMNNSLGALPYDSYIIEELPCETNEGYTLQKFFFTVDEKSQNGFVDLETITDDIPEIGTSASVNGKRDNVTPSKTIKLNDKIKYKGLKIGEKYVAKGILMDKETGKPALDTSGREITAEKEFTSLIGSGWVNVTFEFDATNLYGKDTVVFEKVYDVNGHLVAKHEDINDEDQTIIWEKPSIGTTLTDDKGGKTVVASDKMTLVDTIAYEGLDTTQWYIFEGSLIVKEATEPLVENGSPVTVVSEPFMPKEVTGSVDVTFVIDTTNLIGKELVAFETAYKLEGYNEGDDISKSKKITIAEHKDIDDEGQTVKIVEPEKPEVPEEPKEPEKPEKPEQPKQPRKPKSPETGDASGLKLLYPLLAIAVSLEALLLTKKRRNDRLN